jgi:O-antigen/teichoic acid export membrane protein
MAIAFPMSVFGAVTTARQRFALTGSIAIVAALVQGLATYLVLRAGYGVVTLVSITSLLGVATYAAYAAAARATFPGMRLSLSQFDTAQVREVTAFSVYLFLISIAIHVGLNVDNVIIGANIGTASIAFYTVAVRLADYQRQVCGQFSGFLFPLVVRFDASRDVDALRATLIDGTRIALGLVSGVTLCMLAFGRPIVALWMGPGFGASIGPLYVLALAGVIMVAQGPAGSILLATGRQRLVAIASIVDILLNIGLSLALVSRYGLTGVAIGTALPYALLNVAVLVPVACRTLDIPVRRFTASVMTPSLVALVPAALLAAIIRAAMSAPSFVVILGGSAAVGIVYVAAFCAFGLGAADRARYIGSVRRGAFRHTPPLAAL